MPELPEVQTIVNDLMEARLTGIPIQTVRVFWPRSIAGLGPRTFSRRLTGSRFSGIWRRAKFLVFDIEPRGHLLVHLRMSGRLHLVDSHQPRSAHEHVIIRIGSDRELRFYDPRKFGRFYLVSDPLEILAGLGPEPLADEFTAKTFTCLLRSRKRQIKPLLLDQRFLAGLGNIYADEALWDARIHPLRRSDSLSLQEGARLHRSIRKVLRRGLKNLGTSLGAADTNFYSIARNRGRNRDQLRVFRRTGLPCPRCQSAIVRIRVGQRSTHVCPICQQSP